MELCLLYNGENRQTRKGPLNNTMRDRNDLLISMEIINVIKEIIEVLHLFKKVTRELSSDTNVSVSKIILLSKALQQLTNIHSEVSGSLSEKLQERMRKKFLGIEENILLAGETLLDP